MGDPFLGATGWSNFNYFVTATALNTVVSFGFRDDPSYLGFDDASLVAAAVPTFQSFSRSGSNINFTLSAQAGLGYQLQYKTNLLSIGWVNLGGPVTASSNSVALTTTIGADQQRFYRAQLLP